MARYGFLPDCDDAGAPEAPATAALPEAGAAVWLPQPRHAGGRSFRGFLDAATVRELEGAAASGAALQAVAPISPPGSGAGADANRPASLALPLLLLGGLYLALR